MRVMVSNFDYVGKGHVLIYTSQMSDDFKEEWKSKGESKNIKLKNARA